MKLIKSFDISPFGGLNFILKEFNELKINQLLNSELPTLANQSKYSWSDILYSFWSIYFCGGDCIEDLAGNFKNHLKSNPFLNIPSPDRVLNRFKNLSLPSQNFTVPRGESIHEFSINKLLSELNIKLLKRTNLNNTDSLTLDYDNTIIFTNKKDSRWSYKNKSGYCPGVGIIGKNIVFIENRNGNSDAKTLQEDTLQRMFDLLNKHDIKIDSFRADAASYQAKVIDLISRNTNKLYIRACMSQALAREINKISDWTEVDLGNEKVYRGDIVFIPFERTLKRDTNIPTKPYRLVVTKTLRGDKQINLFTNEAYNYSAIITNDYEMTNDRIVYFYNQRGATEKEFDVMKNDFGWDNLPFSKLEQNTVFLYFTAMCRNLFQYIITLFSLKFKGLTHSDRLKKFIFRFVTIPAKWIRSSRQNKLKIYGDISFKT